MFDNFDTFGCWIQPLRLDYPQPSDCDHRSFISRLRSSRVSSFSSARYPGHGCRQLTISLRGWAGTETIPQIQGVASPNRTQQICRWLFSTKSTIDRLDGVPHVRYSVRQLRRCAAVSRLRMKSTSPSDTM